MKLSFRWYGESDPISLEYIRQIPNMRSVVSAVYDVKPGEVWPEESLKKMKEQVEKNGMLFDIVESVPVPEEIKLGGKDADRLTEVYCENIRRCAKYGVKCITYNFMPVFDWTRTQLDKAAAAIKESRNPREGLSFFAHIAGLFGQRLWFYKKTTGYSSKLKISDACAGCGLCAKNCPAGNLSIKDGRAVSAGRCAMCYKCISTCPKQAVTLLGDKVCEQVRFERYV